MRRVTAIFLPLFATAVGIAKSTPCAAEEIIADGAFEAAVAAARQVVPHSTMIDARYTIRSGRKFYEILFMDADGVLYAVHVDAENARVHRPNGVMPNNVRPRNDRPNDDRSDDVDVGPNNVGRDDGAQPRSHTRKPPPRRPRPSPRPEHDRTDRRQ